VLLTLSRQSATSTPTSSAHLTGFLSGVAAGWAWGMLGNRVLQDSLQRALGFATAAMLALAWAAALSGWTGSQHDAR
jgi:hypothetical protein